MCASDINFYFKLIKTRAIKVHCLTNIVAQNLTANMLLAAGALPSMSADIDEVSDFTASADALLVNLGTMTSITKKSILTAIYIANKNKIPWILDPVFINRSRSRLKFAHQLLDLNPKVIRGNIQEISALKIDQKSLAKKTGAIVIITGKTDIITDGIKTYKLTTGHHLMAYVTAIGCASTAVLAAFIALNEDPFKSAVAAIELFGEIGQITGEKSQGPGQFQINLLDELYNKSQGDR